MENVFVFGWRHSALLDRSNQILPSFSSSMARPRKIAKKAQLPLPDADEENDDEDNEEAADEEDADEENDEEDNEEDADEEDADEENDDEDDEEDDDPPPYWPIPPAAAAAAAANPPIHDIPANAVNAAAPAPAPRINPGRRAATGARLPIPVLADREYPRYVRMLDSNAVDYADYTTRDPTVSGRTFFNLLQNQYVLHRFAAVADDGQQQRGRRIWHYGDQAAWCAVSTPGCQGRSRLRCLACSLNSTRQDFPVCQSCQPFHVLLAIFPLCMPISHSSVMPHLAPL